MNHHIKVLFIFLFSIILSDQAANNLPAAASAKASTARKETVQPATPEELGMSSAKLSEIDNIVKYSIQQRIFPGCQVLVLKDGRPVYDKCFGNYTYDGGQKVEHGTLYDLASLSKTTGTLLAIMKLYDEGKLRLDDKASHYLPFFIGTDKENITIRELLFHESGLPAGLPFYSIAIEKKNNPTKVEPLKVPSTGVDVDKNRVSNPSFRFRTDLASKIPFPDFSLQVSDSFYLNKKFHDAAMQMIARTHLNSKTYVYSCVNFIVLKEIAESISGMSMDAYLDSQFYAPMKLSTLTYLPLRKHKKEEIAPTLKRDFLRNGIVQGYVHDPDAAFLGGVSGNAGLFGSAQDVAEVYQMLLNDGELDGRRYLSAETCKLFTTSVSASGRRGLGFDKPVSTNPLHSPCCPQAPRSVYGHTGYTGTCTWVDPANKLVYVFLSNRTYPDDGINKLAKAGVRTKIQEVIYKAVNNN